MAKKKKPDKAAADDEMWARLARTVEPLPRRKRAPLVADDEAPPPALAKPATKARRPGPRTAPRPAPAAPAPPVLDAGRAPGVDRRTAERLRRGQLPVEARLDLHGLKAAAAEAALSAFVTASHGAGRRCVLVITGKGAAGGGVIKRAVADWLNAPALRPLILAWAWARPEHGGAGALYVLLKRRRQN